MIKYALMATALSLALAGPAFASGCPLEVKAIDDALASSSVSAEMMAEAKALRDKGDALHAAGQHADSIATLQKAKDILGI